MFHNENKNVQTCAGVILWDGCKQPETKEGGAIVHSLKIAIPATSPEAGEIEQLAQATLNASPIFKGVLPPGGEWPLRDIDMAKFADDVARLTGHKAINANTRLGFPSVFDVNGNAISAMQAGPMLYPGAVVKMLVHCYAFDNKSKGVALGLDGIQIIDASTPKLSVGGGMSSAQVGEVFGKGAPAGTEAIPGIPGAEADHAFVANAGRVMTPKAGGKTFDEMINGGQGWTEALLKEHGYMMP